MMMRGAIFDLDGTLLDSMYIWDSIVERYLMSEGYEVKDNVSEAVSSMSMRQACDYLREDYGIVTPTDDLIRAIVDLAGDFYRYDAPLKPGAERFIKELHGRGIRMCIATADDRELTEAALSRNRVLPYFDKIFTCEEVGHGKDEPGIYLAAAEHMGLAKEEVVVFEDSLYAAKTAAAAGFPTVAVYDAHEKAQEELKRTADCFLCGFEDTEDCICRVSRAIMAREERICLEP